MPVFMWHEQLRKTYAERTISLNHKYLNTDAGQLDRPTRSGHKKVLAVHREASGTRWVTCGGGIVRKKVGKNAASRPRKRVFLWLNKNLRRSFKSTALVWIAVQTQLFHYTIIAEAARSNLLAVFSCHLEAKKPNLPDRCNQPARRVRSDPINFIDPTHPNRLTRIICFFAD